MYKFYENKEARLVSPVQAVVDATGEFRLECEKAFSTREMIEFKGASWHVIQIKTEVDTTEYLIGDFRMRHPEPWCKVTLQLA